MATAEAHGIFQLKTADDLLKKLRHDCQRLVDSPFDQYAAFDFFVTAEHMADWILPSKTNDKARKNLRSSSELLQMCSHVANGSKHFHAEAKHHQSVSRTSIVLGSLSKGFSSGFKMGGLAIYTKDAAKEKFGEKAYAHELAKQILSYWESHLGNVTP